MSGLSEAAWPKPVRERCAIAAIVVSSAIQRARIRAIKSDQAVRRRHGGARSKADRRLQAAVGTSAGDDETFGQPLGIDDHEWPVSGIPGNASEFHLEALTRGREQHGMAPNYHPVATLNHGGIVERLIDRLM